MYGLVRAALCHEKGRFDMAMHNDAILSRRSFLAITGLSASSLALTACGGSGSSSSAAGSSAGSAASSGDATWDAINSAKTIKVGTETAYAPYAYRDADDKLTGFDVEIGNAIYEKMGLTVDWMDTKWDSLISGMDAKQCDACMDQIAITDERKEKYIFSEPYCYAYGGAKQCDACMDQIAITDERKEKYIFSEPYCYAYGGVLALPESGITSIADLSGKNCAGTATSNWIAIVEKNGGVLVTTTGFQDSVQLVEQGRADAVLVEELTELDYLKNNPDSPLQIVARTDDFTEVAVMMRQDCTELQAKINEAIAALKEDGTLAEISKKYFEEDVTVQK